MQIALGYLTLSVMGSAIFLWLYIRENGRAYFWGRLAARCRANYEAALLREKRDGELLREWAVAARKGGN